MYLLLGVTWRLLKLIIDTGLRETATLNFPTEGNEKNKDTPVG
jgi:hypothetical protein